MRLPIFNLDLPDPPAGTIMTNGSIFGIALGDGDITTHGCFWVKADGPIKPFQYVEETTMGYVQAAEPRFVSSKKMKKHKHKFSTKLKRALR